MKRHTHLIVLLVCILAVPSAFAQLNPLAAQYFNNPYLGNPAHAGIDEGFDIAMAYRKLWSGVTGTPEVQNLTATYGYRRTGIGLNVNFDRAGLQRQTRVVGSYAYHLPLGANRQVLHFGVSLGAMDQRLSSGDINGDPNDPLAQQYNQRETYVDGDFGVAYTTERLKLEASLPNLNSLLKRSDIRLADLPTFYAAASYHLVLMDELDGVVLEPKVAYRGVKSFDNILDVGANLSFADRQVLLMGMYHSSKSASFGVGLNYKRKYLLSGAYTTQTSALSSYTNGSFELGLKLYLAGSRK
ncbi:type IX secretion system membrane protein PorP/SprF [Pedobacter sp. UC225_65]|uniref:PorP/SprF family type IX secretion system membrane protein n=1 Tax=Pedobacter sp. UC225_65 TaxID=3350173 RepID=UPI00366BF2A1